MQGNNHMTREYHSINDAATMGMLLTPRDVSAILQTSRSFTYRLLQIGAIPVVRLGKACRVRPQDLVEFIESNLHRPADNYVSLFTQGKP
jgi:excisionase family DNA binding protein